MQSVLCAAPVIEVLIADCITMAGPTALHHTFACVRLDALWLPAVAVTAWLIAWLTACVKVMHGKSMYMHMSMDELVPIPTLK